MKTASPLISLIVAAADNNVIGKNNQLPWHLPRDLQYFKRITTGCPIIMGRKTYESIGKALPQRLNIVITHNSNYLLEDAEVVHSLPAAIELAKHRQADAREIHIIGGAAIFTEAIPLIDKIYLNRVRADIDGDTLLPAIDWQQWQLIDKTHHAADDKNAYALDFEVYSRQNAAL
ncbi:MAG: dihydrofolate reductase [Gammaproteobacteria bacterium]|nr:MAG: dihydrofolate reductase [Gammaproteobacteria bacterium]